MAEEITVNIKPTQVQAWGRTVRAFLLIAALIGPGIVLDSAAMQWMGFLIVLLVVVSLAVGSDKANKGLTPDQARARIAELEAKGR